METIDTRDSLGYRVWLFGALFALLVASFFAYVQAENAVDRANERRAASLVLAGELRQSSDDLSRMVRSYVVTGNALYKQHFLEILAIRDGVQARPLEYQNVYWDLVGDDDVRPRARSDERIALLLRVQQAGVAPSELAKLTEAKRRSDALTDIEFAAMRLVEGAAPVSAAVRLQAVLMLTDPRYKLAKAAIMAPIGEFARMQGERTLADVRSHQRSARVALIVFLSLGATLLVVLWSMYRAYRATMGGSIDAVYAGLNRLGQGDFSHQIVVRAGQENSVIGWMAQTQQRLSETERQRALAEAEITLHTRFLRNLTDNIPGMVGYWTAQLRCKFANRAYLEWFGRSDEVLIGLPMREVLGEELFAKNSGYVTAALAGTAQRFERQITKPDGSVGHTWTHYTPDLVDGVVAGVFVVITDISEVKLAQHALAQERQRLRGILDGIQAGTWEWDLASGAMLLDERSAGMLGYTLAELEPVGIDALMARAHRDDAARAKAALAQHLDGQLAVYACDMRMRHRLGHWVWILTRGGVVRSSADGTPQTLAGTYLDISENKRRDQQFLDIRQALDAHAIVAITDRKGVITYANDQFCRISKFARAQLLGQTHRVVNSDLHPAEFFADMWRTIRAGKTWNGEIANRASDGAVYWVNTTIAPILDSSGKPDQYIAIRYEITQSKLAQAQLLAARDEQDAILNTAPIGIAFIKNRVIVHGNRKFGQLFNVALDELVGRSTRIWYASEADYQQGESAYSDMARGQMHAREQQMVRADGSSFMCRLFGRYLEPSEPERGSVWMLEDITEQRRQENALRNNEARLRSLLDNMPVGLCLVDGAQRITFRNRRFGDMFGYTGADLPDLDSWWRLAYPDPDYVRWVRQHWDASVEVALDGNTVIRPEIYSVTCKDQSVKKTEISGITTEFGFLATFVDHTLHQQQQEQLQRSMTAAHVASRAKGDFLATMSHEIRTPMNGILGMLKLLEHTELSARQRDYTSKAMGATDALLGIVNDVLDFSKVEAGKMRLDSEPFDLADVMRDLSVLLSANQGSKDIELLFSIDPAIPAVLVGDAMRLRQVLLNLAGNAIKFTERGEVVVGIALLHRGPSQLSLEFSVRDSGIGIAADKLDYIFEGFSQAESSTSRRFGGSGLGLAISRQLVGLMGGDLKVDSREGHGSRFYFRIDCAFAALAPTPLGGRASGHDGRALRVLIIDDHDFARDMLCAMSQSLGWDAQAVASGEQALQLLGQAGVAPFELILVDWRMPGLDGLETTRRIRAMETAARAPVVIMVSAHGRELLTSSASEHGTLLDAYLVKPITASMLLDAVTGARAQRGVGVPTVPDAQPQPQPGEAALAGLRLLVVEDNLLNQQASQELLGMCGALVQIAGGGLDGVAQALAADPPFDAILMDMQMPDIDGLEATRRIRAHPHMRALPIIAMTANAMASDRQACLAAGMVDHVSKPIDLDELVGAIVRHTRAAQQWARNGAPDARMPALPAPAPGAGTIVDVAGAVRRLGGNRHFYAKVQQSFLVDAPEQLRSAREHVRAARWSDAELAMHTLKGYAGTLGARLLQGAARQAEALLHELPLGAPAEAPAAMLAQLLREVEQLMIDVLLVLPGAHGVAPAQTPAPHPRAAPDAHTTAVLVAAVREIRLLLQTRNMRASLAVEALAASHGPHLGAAGSALGKAVGQLDFALADTLCVALLAQWQA